MNLPVTDLAASGAIIAVVVIFVGVINKMQRNYEAQNERWFQAWVAVTSKAIEIFGRVENAISECKANKD